MIKKLIFKIILLLTIVFFMNYLLRNFSNLPYGWFDNGLSKKVENAFNGESKYNTAILGTSRVYRGIIPKVLDQTVKENSNLKLKSFNYGIGGFTAGETYSLYKHLLKNKEKIGLEYVFLEFRSIRSSVSKNFSTRNLHTNRSKYWIDLPLLKMSLRGVQGLDSDMFPLSKKIELSFNYIILFLENKLNISMMESMVMSKVKKTNVKKNAFPEEGFSALDDAKEKSHQKRRDLFLKTLPSEDLEARRTESIKTLEHNIIERSLNRQYLEEAQNLIKLGEDAGVKVLFFVLAGVRAEDFDVLAGVFNKLPKENTIDLANASAIPSLYDIDYMWDVGHLNRKGAELASKELAMGFIQKQKKGNNNKITAANDGSENVVWTNSKGVKITKSSIAKTTNGDWGAAGAISKQELGQQQNGWVSTVVEETNTNRIFGFSGQDKDKHYKTVHYGLMLTDKGTLEVYEHGQSKGEFGAYKKNDVLKIERRNKKIYYKINDKNLYISTKKSESNVKVDVSFLDKKASLQDMKVSF